MESRISASEYKNQTFNKIRTESIFDGKLWTIQLRRFGILQYMQAFKLFLKFTDPR